MARPEAVNVASKAACWRLERRVVMLVTMRKAPLAKAKAHLSELVDAAEHRGQATLILRHGKPAAALVPLAALRDRPERVPMSAEAARRLMDRLVASPPRESTLTLEEALGRERLESP